MQSVVDVEHAAQFALDLVDVFREHGVEFLVVDDDRREPLCRVLRNSTLNSPSS